MPPQDHDAEQSVHRLDAAVEGRHRRRRSRRSAARDFYRPAHETIFDAMIDLYGRGEPVDPVTTVGGAEPPGRAGAGRRRAVPPHAVGVGPDRGQRLLLRRDRAREGDPAAARQRRHQIVQMGYAGEGMVDDVVDAAQQEVYQVTDKRTSRGLRAAERDHGGAPSTRSRRSPTAAAR